METLEFKYLTMKKIPLKEDKYVLVDDEDYDFMSRFNWYASVGGVTTRIPKQNGKYILVEMWRFLVNTKQNTGHFKKEIVYKDKNNLNLQKENLVIVDIPTTLHLNKKRTRGNFGETPTSMYKGVSCRRRMTRKKDNNIKYTPPTPWRAEITYRGKTQLKYFKTEKEAGLWYNKKAKELYGEYAYQNKIEE